MKRKIRGTINRKIKRLNIRRGKSEKGITLLVLVITIIVLLILAGITIGALTGDNGIISNSKTAKEETEIANEKEILEKATVEAMGKNKYGNIEKERLQSELTEYSVDVIQSGSTFICEFPSQRKYIINQDGDVIEKRFFSI